MTTNDWYEVVGPAVPLTQGDLILRCPILRWKALSAEELQALADPQRLQQATQLVAADVVVMTQACDMEHGKVPNVVLCPHMSITTFRQGWEKSILAMGQNPTAKAWRATCNDIADGYIWNQAFLNCIRVGGDDLESDLRIVDFHEVLTVPRGFLELLIQQRVAARPRLLPPYREHLSQAFARFFMRVGLPTPIEKTW